jgi:hypothetical protein
MKSESSSLLGAFDHFIAFLTAPSARCLVCYESHGDGIDSLKPTPCEKEICVYQDQLLLTGVQLAGEIARNPFIADFLVSIFFAGMFYL